MRRPGRPWAAVQSCRPGVERISRIEGAASVMVIDAASLTTAAASHTTAAATHTTAGGASSTTTAEGTRAVGARTAAARAITAPATDMRARPTATATPSAAPRARVPTEAGHALTRTGLARP